MSKIIFLLAIWLSVHMKCCESQIASPVFGDNMVLQRDEKATIFGQTFSSAIVTLTINGVDTYTSSSSVNGQWSLSLKEYPASFSNTITITATSQTDSQSTSTQTIQNVAFGDVFLCSGQANMQYTVSNSFNFQSKYYNDKFDNIRWYTVNWAASVDPTHNISNLINSEGTDKPTEAQLCGHNKWCLATPETLNQGSKFDPNQGNLGDPFLYPSAVCYFTMRNLYLKLNGTVPIGAVISSLSGSPIEAWGSHAAWQACPGSNVEIPPPGTVFDSYYWVSCLYNSMIYPILQMKFKSVIWYQGEGNSDSIHNADLYECQIVSFIKDWRFHFNNSQLPFIIVMITPWPDAPKNAGGFFALGRNSQLAALTLPHTAVTGTIDLGDNPDLDPTDHGEHPESKDEVGYRVYLQLWNLVYGGSFVANGPYFGALVWPSPENGYKFIFDYSSAPSSSVSYFNEGLHFGPSFKCTPPSNSTNCCDISPYSVVTNKNSEIPAGAPQAKGYRVQPTVNGTQIIIPISEAQYEEGIVYIALDYEGYPACVLLNSDKLPHYPFIINIPNPNPPNGGNDSNTNQDRLITLATIGAAIGVLIMVTFCFFIFRRYGEGFGLRAKFPSRGGVHLQEDSETIEGFHSDITTRLTESPEIHH